MLVTSEKEQDVVVLHLPIELLKTRSGLSQYQDAIPLADDLATAPSGLVTPMSGPMGYDYGPRVCTFLLPNQPQQVKIALGKLKPYQVFLRTVLCIQLVSY